EMCGGKVKQQHLRQGLLIGKEEIGFLEGIQQRILTRVLQRRWITVLL
ncbi:phosphoenolpyruvate carboxykinase, partial [Chlamydia suis MD56]